MDNSENVRTKQGIVYDFVENISSVKRAFIIYTNVLNRLGQTYGNDLEIAKIEDNDKAILSQTLGEMQYYFFDIQLSLKAISKKKSIDSKSLYNEINLLRKEYVPDPEKVQLVIENLNDFLVEHLVADMESEGSILKGLTR